MTSTLARTVHVSFIFISALLETTFQFHASPRKPKPKSKRHIDRQQTADSRDRRTYHTLTHYSISGASFGHQARATANLPCLYLPIRNLA